MKPTTAGTVLANSKTKPLTQTKTMTTKTETMNQLNQIIELGNRKSVESSKMRELAFRQMMKETELLWMLNEMDSEEREQMAEAIQEEFDDSMAEALRLQDKATEAWNAARDFHFHTIDNTSTPEKN